MVCDILVLICGIYIYIYVVYMEKQKTKKKRILEVASPSACAVALGKEGFFFKKNKFLCRVTELRHSAKSI